jgi:hypothetical protein
MMTVFVPDVYNGLAVGIRTLDDTCLQMDSSSKRIMRSTSGNSSINSCRFGVSTLAMKQSANSAYFL